MVVKVLKDGKHFSFSNLDTIKEAKSYYAWVMPELKGLTFEVVE